MGRKIEELTEEIIEIMENTLASKMSVWIGDGVHEELVEKITRALESE